MRRPRARLPGDPLVPDAHLQTTRTIEIEASPSDIWPWLVQMGQGRGGFYTYEWVENLLAARIHNLDRIEPDLQALTVGDRVRLTPDVYLGRLPGQHYRVQEIHPMEALTMLQELPAGAWSSWSFTLRPVGAARTRLIVRGRASAPSDMTRRAVHEVELLLLEPGYFLMERGMLRGIRKRAEATAKSSANSFRPSEGAPG